MAILEVDTVDTFYGKSHVLQGISLKVEKGQIVALLGRNGAGKTTTFRSIMGLTPPKHGTIKFKGVNIQGKKAFEIAKLGIGIVPENREIFPEITVKDNLEIAIKDSPLGTRNWNIKKVYDYFPILEERKNNKGKNLSGGEQQMLSIARTLMGNPELILLDEPCEGLAPQVVAELFNLVKLLREKERLTIFIAEQNVNFSLALSDWVYLLEKGVVRYSANSEKIKADEEIKQKYLAV